MQDILDVQFLSTTVIFFLGGRAFCDANLYLPQLEANRSDKYRLWLDKQLAGASTP